MAFLEWLQSTWVGVLVAESLWGYPLFETIHSLGMAMLIGSLGLINLRVLGFKPDLPLLGMRQLLPLAWLGFTLNAISGTLLFTSDAVYFFESYTFRIKMVLIVLGGLNAALLGQRVFREAAGGRAGSRRRPARSGSRSRRSCSGSARSVRAGSSRTRHDAVSAFARTARNAPRSSAMEFLVWLENTPIANAIRTIPWLYPAFETGHYIGLSLLVGGIMLIDLRVLGMARALPLKSMIGLLPFVWAGFIINVLTGSMLFIYGATNFGAERRVPAQDGVHGRRGLERARVRRRRAPLGRRTGLPPIARRRS